MPPAGLPDLQAPVDPNTDAMAVRTPDNARVAALAETIARQLKARGRPERAENERRYLKSALQHYGVRVPDTRAVVTRVARENPDLDRASLTALVEQLWETEVFEQRMAAVELLVVFQNRLASADLSSLEALLRQCRTWALLDPLAITVVGGLIDGRPKLQGRVQRWAKDEDFWLRRAALLSQMLPLRRGNGSFDPFGKMADRLLEDREFFIRKAIGWVLREAGKRRPDLVFDWLAPRVHRASGVTVREAVKPLDERQRRTLLAAYRSGCPAALRSARS